MATTRNRKSFLFDLINTIIKKHCYIKKHGRAGKYRVMDEWHNPIINITEANFNWLQRTDFLKPHRISGFPVWIAAVAKNPYRRYADINLSGKKQEQVQA